jgi:hypothetical protein
VSKGEGFKRSVCVEQFSYNNDGSIPLIEPTKEGVNESVSNLDPYAKVEAETIAWSEGLKTKSDSKAGIYVTNINDGEYLIVKSVDFGKGAKKFKASVATASEGGEIEIRLDNPDGKILGTCKVGNTGGDLSWKVFSGKINKVKGVHDICLVFKGEEKQLFNIDWWGLNDKK